MKRGQWTALLAGVFPIAGFGVYALGGCYGVVPNDGLVDAGPPPKVDAPPPLEGGGESGYVVPGAPCDTAAGAVPPPNCHIPFTTSLSCTPNSGAACATGANCGESACLPTTTNKAPEYNFRMANLYIVSPAVLASVLVQGSVVTSALTLNAPSCGYAMTTFAGSFNWLLSFNTMTKTLTTGGGTPVTDPYKDPYCFVDTTFTPEGGTGTLVAPVDFPMEVTGNTFKVTPQTQVLNVPIFQAADNLKDPIILPVRGVRLTATMSPDGNCIGDINTQWSAWAASGNPQGACSDTELSACPKWFTNGSLAGYITIKDAESVQVVALGESLCQLLSGAACTSSTKGNYCSTTQSAGGCNDSFWLAAIFAANAVQVSKTGPAPCKP